MTKHLGCIWIFVAIILVLKASPIDSPDWTSVVVQDPAQATPLAMEWRFIVFSPPIIMENGVWPTSAGPKPFWFEPYDIQRHLDKYSYSQFAEQHTRETIERNLITELKFKKLKADYDSKRTIPAIVSVVWELDVRWKGRTLAFIVSDTYERLNAVPGETGHAPFSINLYELVSGKWKIQSLEEVGILKTLPFVNHAVLEEIIKQGKAKPVYGVLMADKPKKK